MTVLKREIFSRSNRMVHKFGETQRIDDPMQRHTFNLPMPNPVGVASTKPCNVQEYGEHNWRQESSPVQKPSGGMATINGPSLDEPGMFAMAIPVSTKRRKQP